MRVGCSRSGQWVEVGRLVRVGMVVIGSEEGSRLRGVPWVNVRELIGRNNAGLFQIHLYWNDKCVEYRIHMISPPYLLYSEGQKGAASASGKSRGPSLQLW